MFEKRDKMRIVTANQLQDWLSRGEVLEKDARGAKVLKLNDGDILKIFRSRRHPLLVRLMPDAQRFARCGERLRERGVSTPCVKDCFWIDRSAGISGCLYSPLEGSALDKIFLNERGRFDELLPQLAAYIFKLHQQGIYFRSLHLGNILLVREHRFGLIDFLDTRFRRPPLSARLVQRNFHHLRRYLARSKISDFPWDELMRHYTIAAQPS
ncbi:lipopolysaccharide kinase InaA family protein [Pseudomonas sp. R1-7]|uniref:lipopolysaccharide kinase InaA family protein n=1 Tax=Pseudomonas sp. R1-7 TaxID=2817398 RepID=UPI003DA7D40D